MIPAALLREPPYSLAQGTPVSPKIRFKNAIGFSEWSDGVSVSNQMQDVPHPPVNPPKRIEELTFGL